LWSFFAKLIGRSLIRHRLAFRRLIRDGSATLGFSVARLNKPAIFGQAGDPRYAVDAPNMLDSSNPPLWALTPRARLVLVARGPASRRPRSGVFAPLHARPKFRRSDSSLNRLAGIRSVSSRGRTLTHFRADFREAGQRTSNAGSAR
jgi:hypothetical protein